MHVRWHQACLPGRSSIAERADEYASHPEAECAVYARDTTARRVRRCASNGPERASERDLRAAFEEKP